MIKRKKRKEWLFPVVNYGFLLILGFIFVYPVIHVIAASFSNPTKLMQHQGGLLWPLGFSLKGYQVVLSNPNIISGYINTLINMVLGTSVSILSTIIGAYVLSRKDFMFRRVFTWMIVITMYIGGGMIPNFLLVKNLGMLDTRWSVIIPGCISTWNLIVMKTCFNQLPASLEESARIDGANDLTILFKILVPLAKPTVMVLVLFYAVGQWNSWFTPMLYLQDRDLFPVALIIREILISNSGGGGGSMTGVFSSAAAADIQNLSELIKYSSIVVTALPIMCVYPFIQKYFVTGMMMGSIKE